MLITTQEFGFEIHRIEGVCDLIVIGFNLSWERNVRTVSDEYLKRRHSLVVDDALSHREDIHSGTSSRPLSAMIAVSHK